MSEAHVQKIAELFQDEYQRVVHYVVARTGSWREARDIAAQAFTQVLEMRNPETVSFLKAYVYRSARNLATNQVKLRANRKRIDGIARHEFASESPSPESLLIEQQQAEVLQRAIKNMRSSRRMVLTLRIWDGLPYAEIVSKFAEEGLAVNERTLNRWFADALDELRQAILAAEDLKEEGGR